MRHKFGLLFEKCHNAVCLFVNTPALSTNKQTNKTAKIYFQHSEDVMLKEGLGAHLQCSRSILHNSMLGSLSKPTILDAFNSNVIWDFHLSANYSFPQNGL